MRDRCCWTDPAGQARTLARGATNGMLTTWPPTRPTMVRHAADDRGRPVMTIDADDALSSTVHQGHHGLPSGSLEIIDIAPVPLAQRQRARLQLAGFLTPLPPAQVDRARERLATYHPVEALESLGHRHGLLLTRWTTRDRPRTRSPTPSTTAPTTSTCTAVAAADSASSEVPGGGARGASAVHVGVRRRRHPQRARGQESRARRSGGVAPPPSRVGSAFSDA